MLRFWHVYLKDCACLLVIGWGIFCCTLNLLLSLVCGRNKLWASTLANWSYSRSSILPLFSGMSFIGSRNVRNKWCWFTGTELSLAAAVVFKCFLCNKAQWGILFIVPSSPLWAQHRTVWWMCRFSAKWGVFTSNQWNAVLEEKQLRFSEVKLSLPHAGGQCSSRKTQYLMIALCLV